jgi:hypothetical protein
VTDINIKQEHFRLSQERKTSSTWTTAHFPDLVITQLTTDGGFVTTAGTTSAKLVAVEHADYGGCKLVMQNMYSASRFVITLMSVEPEALCDAVEALRIQAEGNAKAAPDA